MLVYFENVFLYLQWYSYLHMSSQSKIKYFYSPCTPLTTHLWEIMVKWMVLRYKYGAIVFNFWNYVEEHSTRQHSTVWSINSIKQSQKSAKSQPSTLHCLQTINSNSLIIHLLTFFFMQISENESSFWLITIFFWVYCGFGNLKELL